MATLPAVDFASRRKSFLHQIKGGLALFPAAPELLRNPDVTHPYRQESSFFYLSGFEEPESFLLFHSNSKTPFQMFVRPRDSHAELWEGKRFGPEGAKKHFGAYLAKESTPEKHLEEAFIAALLESDRLYYRVGLDAELDKKVFQWMTMAKRKLGRSGRAFWPILDPMEILGEQRLYKSKQEIDRLQKAADITAEGHLNAMRLARPGMHEYEVEAVLYHAFRNRGAARLGYGSIVASGANACILHYVENQKKMAPKELLLIDAGAEFEYYTADISRTFPVSGSFTDDQRDVYAAVLRAQKECIKMARPGKTLREIHLHAVEVLCEELKRMKVLKGNLKQLIDKKAYLPFYPHGTGHWLGLDVHDVGTYYVDRPENQRKLKPGMVFTVEPGLYFSPNAKCPARLKGIGVRIEDDILITSDGNKVLTSRAPKEIEEVESICQSS